MSPKKIRNLEQKNELYTYLRTKDKKTLQESRNSNGGSTHNNRIHNYDHISQSRYSGSMFPPLENNNESFNGNNIYEENDYLVRNQEYSARNGNHVVADIPIPDSPPLFNISRPYR